jgi:hypothetical protein
MHLHGICKLHQTRHAALPKLCAYPQGEPARILPPGTNKMPAVTTHPGSDTVAARPHCYVSQRTTWPEPW